MKVLFICTQNLMRSPTAEALYRGRPDLDVRSAGVAKDARVPARMFRAGYARIEEFTRYLDPMMSSSFWRRVSD